MGRIINYLHYLTNLNKNELISKFYDAHCDEFGTINKSCYNFAILINQFFSSSDLHKETNFSNLKEIPYLSTLNLKRARKFHTTMV